MKTTKAKTDPQNIESINKSPILVTIDDNTYEDVARIFKVLADPTRLKIIAALINKELCVQEIAGMLNMSLPAILHHLKSLKDSRLIKYRRDGKKAIYLIDNTLLIQLFARGLASYNKKI
jgi:DNA-binding transcriptional ArsR family regulator